MFLEHCDASAFVGIQRQSEINLDDNALSDDISDESMKEVHLNDNEQERAKDNDDGFDIATELHARATKSPFGKKEEQVFKKAMECKERWLREWLI